MNLDFKENFIDIAELENQKTGNKYNVNSLALLNKQSFKDEVNDSPSIYRIDGFRSEDDSIIIISNHQFPDFVNEAVRKINIAVSVLEPRLGKHVLCPSSTGIYGLQSYAFWPRHKAISDNRVLKRVQILSVHEKAFQWLCDVSRTTQHSVNESEELINQYIEPLTFLINQDYVPGTIKKIASDTLGSLEASNFRPVCIFQHGDFWYGNILLERSWPISRKSHKSFFVIDWGGADTHGYPYVDQLRYLMSVGKRDSVMSRYLVLYSNFCGLSINDIVRYVCTYAGYLGMNRNEFPLDRYLKLIDTLVLKASCFSNGLSQMRN